MTHRSFMVLIGSMALASALVGHTAKVGSLEVVTSELTSKLRESEIDLQSRRDRIWHNLDLLKTSEVKPGTDSVIYGPIRLKISADDHLFLADFGDLSIKEFSETGDLLQIYGHGKGQGPGEFTTITDFSLERLKELWVADDSNGRISIFERGGRLIQTIKSDTPAYRIVTRTAGGFFLMHPFRSSGLFSRFDINDTRLESFGQFIGDQENHPLVLDGWIEPDEADGFVYAGHYASLVAAYDPNGLLRFTRWTIDPKPLPKLVRNSKGTMWVDREAEGSAWSLSVSNKKIYLLSATHNGLKRVGIIDVYNLEDGDYLYSSKLPEAAGQVAVRNGYLYTSRGDTAVTKWEMR